MRTQNGQIVAVGAHHVGFVLDTGGYIALVDLLSLSNHRILEFDGRIVEDDHIDLVSAEGRGEVVSQLRANLVSL